MNTYLGAGTQKIPISVYHSTLNGYPTTMSVSEGCIPVGASFHGTDEAGSTSYYYMIFYVVNYKKKPNFIRTSREQLFYLFIMLALIIIKPLLHTRKLIETLSKNSRFFFNPRFSF